MYIALANISKLAEGKLSLSTDLGSEPTTTTSTTTTTTTPAPSMGGDNDEEAG